MRAVVDALTPVIQVRVARVLVRYGSAAPGRDVRQEIADLTQDVFVSLFENGGRVLRSWAPERGLSLKNFVGLAAERLAIGRLRTAKRNPWTEEPAEPSETETELPSPDLPESTAFSRELLRKLADRLRKELTPLGMLLFRLLYLEELAVEEVCARAQLSQDAVYAWRSRLGRRARALACEILSDRPGSTRIPGRGSA